MIDTDEDQRDHGTCHEVERYSSLRDLARHENNCNLYIRRRCVSHASAFNGALSFFFSFMTDENGFH